MQFPRFVSSTTTGTSPAVKRPSVTQEDKNYVGLDLLQDQTKMKALKRGFVFNIMIVGKSGLGKSTLVDTLFKSSVSPNSCKGSVESVTEDKNIPSTTEITTRTSVLNEKGVKLTLTVIDSPGFGDQVNNENCWEPIITYINRQYETFLNEELKINRPVYIQDSRVHCCLYFIEPTGHSLSSLDIEVLKRLCEIVNVIPLVAKADTLTTEERESFKERIKTDLNEHKIAIYPNENFEEGDEKSANDKIREEMPFAVVGSTKFHELNGRKILGRKTKWGLVEIENKKHNDFSLLRELVIRTHLTDLVEVTSTIHFETYRIDKISTLEEQQKISIAEEKQKQTSKNSKTNEE